jgi:hypothetical protein
MHIAHFYCYKKCKTIFMMYAWLQKLMYVRISFSLRERAPMPNVAPPHRIACRMPHTWNVVLFRHQVKYITHAEHNQDIELVKTTLT